MKRFRNSFIIIGFLMAAVIGCARDESAPGDVSQYQPFDKPHVYQVIRGKDNDGNSYY